MREKPEGKIRILVLGDSYTLGHEVNQQETYSYVLETNLKNNGFNVEVINAGVSGFSSAEELIFFEQEGIKYKPDILILGFYNNDIIDNIRTNLFILENGTLVLNKREYQPAIKTRDFLNSFYIYRWLGEHSYLHNYVNTAATLYLKNLFIKNNVENMGDAQPDMKKSIEQHEGREIIVPDDIENNSYEIKLACKIIEKIKATASENNISFLLLDVALDIPGKRPELYASFPSACINEKLLDYYVNSVDLLKNFPGSRDELYRPHGRAHWTDKSHLLVGNYLATIIGPLIEEKQKLSSQQRSVITNAGQ